MRSLSALFLSIGLLACGGSKPAPQQPTEEEATTDEVGDSDMPVENEHCCCSHDEVLEDMSMGECDAAGGACADDPNACNE